MRADELKQGGTYFCLFYLDEQLTIPTIETLVYLGPDAGGSSEPRHMFQSAESHFADGDWNHLTAEQRAEYDEPPLQFFEGDDLDPITDKRGLVEQLGTWLERTT
jgi:hypothetical protein